MKAKAKYAKQIAKLTLFTIDQAFGGAMKKGFASVAIGVLR